MVSHMKGLSLVGLVVVLAIAGVLVANSLKPDPTTGEPTITEPIDRAEEAAETLENSADRIQDAMNNGQ
jgi:hypothetical protein